MKLDFVKRAAAVGCIAIALIGSAAGCGNQSNAPSDLAQQQKEAMGSTPGPATLALIAEARAKARAQSAAAHATPAQRPTQ